MRFLVLVVTAGCAQYATYGYQYRVAQHFDAGAEPDPISAEARQLLATAHTVAFYPPDYCVNSESGEHKAKDLRATCGVLLSTLERAAEQAGFEVLSWQNLRGSKRPIDFAREANVDVLFEINEFEPGELSELRDPAHADVLRPRRPRRCAAAGLRWGRGDVRQLRGAA